MSRDKKGKRKDELKGKEWVNLKEIKLQKEREMTCLEKEKWRERKGDMKEYDSKEKRKKMCQSKNEEKKKAYKKKKSKTGK